MAEVQAGWFQCLFCQCLVHESVSRDHICAVQYGQSWIGGPPTTAHMSGTPRINYLVTRGDDPAEGQPGWRWCTACSSLFFPRKAPTRCPARARVVGMMQGVPRPILEFDAHVADGAHYVVRWQDSPQGGQPGWRHCRHCTSLFFVRESGEQGICVGGGSHDATGSGNYAVQVDSPKRPLLRR